ncbi:uncharacterized protein THITE_2088696 [Thermothielavioides terrestris NRRL 8126]|uniref:Uncharacterized protein n=1 Tax=Thermothielavioides terrestris (strain ATCC 38088 / NRRL 8126) TaxID=578455 RepID=G2QZT9_THETT|nr:uncharacterized protein THITE_2088696 [Thermothielavioides terrestris NRRL 8126]AEO67214.1 hypothetical protein THITE_2088696 [Thermothielavioides terrestris NRRL 8126]
MAVVVSPCNPSFPQLRLLGVPEAEEYQLRPLGWENDGDEERLSFSSLGYLAACTYNCYTLL